MNLSCENMAVVNNLAAMATGWRLNGRLAKKYVAWRQLAAAAWRGNGAGLAAGVMAAVAGVWHGVSPAGSAIVWRNGSASGVASNAMAQWYQRGLAIG